MTSWVDMEEAGNELERFRRALKAIIGFLQNLDETYPINREFRREYLDELNKIEDEINGG